MKMFNPTLSRPLSLAGLICVLCLGQGCSTPESQKRLDTALCWLRPSCLPSQLPSGKAPEKPTVSRPSPAPPRPKTIQQVSSHNGPSVSCVTFAKVTVHASTPYATVSYVEPTTNSTGQALTNLAKTTIYYDVGKGFIKYKDIPATTPEGGGTVQEKISYSLREGTHIQTPICVTATNTYGQEG